MEADRWTEFEQLVRAIGVGLLTTHQSDGTLHTRPLQLLEVRRQSLWFVTDHLSAKVDEIRGDVRVSVGFADIGAHRYAAVSGAGVLRRDPALARELWHVDQRAYYPDGPEDSPIAILEVSIGRAEYWLAPGRGAYYLAALKATFSGERVTTIGKNQKL